MNNLSLLPYFFFLHASHRPAMDIKARDTERYLSFILYINNEVGILILLPFLVVLPRPCSNPIYPYPIIISPPSYPILGFPSAILTNSYPTPHHTTPPLSTPLHPTTHHNTPPHTTPHHTTQHYTTPV